MTDAYRGPAVVVLGDVEHHALVDLSIHRDSEWGRISLQSWDGVVDAAPEIDWFNSPEADEVTLRMPDGREGRFVATAGALGSGQVEICGTGPAPFGDF
ncbi:DUF4873 domain-containing protein [Streptomyces sp. NPDC093272]|uniref:DUF4873 domain-containing protein n=1 Tax=Streptomyces sp. NPDC093272 TaxID=3154981 RepID=UPI0034121343